MKRKINLLVIGILFGISVFAQTTENGFYLLRMKQFVHAEAAFKKAITTNPLDAKANYGMGEYYLSIGKSDSALANFQRGIIKDKKNAYNYLGLAKIAVLKDDNVNVSLNIEAAKKYGKKDASVFVEVAKIYRSLKNQKPEDISKCIEDAKNINSKSSDIYLLLAEIALAKGDASDAASQFESSIYFDSTKFEAYLGVAKIYASAQNSTQAIDYLNTLIRKTPECVIAYRELGELYFKLGKYSDAKVNLKKYIETAEFTPEEKERYAYSLFFSKEFDNAKTIINELSNNNPDNYIMLRLLSYTHYEQAEYKEGVAKFEQFFAKVPSNKILALDYEYFARTLQKNGSDSLAAVNLELAFALDTTKAFLIDDAAQAYTKGKVYEKAVVLYTKSFERKDSAKRMNSDYFQLGRANYYAGYALQMAGDTIRMKEYLVKADTLFGTVYSLNSKSHLGLLWRGRVNSLMDPSTSLGLAKPYYDKALEIFILTPEKFKRELIETYSYLGFYYLTKTDYPNAKIYFTKVLEIDPANVTALDVMKGFQK